LVNHRLREDLTQAITLVDTGGRRRSPAILPSYHQGRPPRNKGRIEEANAAVDDSRVIADEAMAGYAASMDRLVNPQD
jgi:hypothetical protein